MAKVSKVCKEINDCFYLQGEEDTKTYKIMKEKIIEFWKELRYHVRGSVVLWMEALKLRLAIYLADVRQKARNRRFHVVLMIVGIDRYGRPIERLRSIDNEGFKYCKRNGWLPKRMTYVEMSQKAFYSTELKRNNSLTREERRKAMRRYMTYQRAINSL